MEIIGPVIIFVIVILILSFCGWCCNRRTEGTVISGPPPVIQPQQVTLQHAMPPYHQMPDHSIHVGTQSTVTPYPVQTHMPMPMPVTNVTENPAYPTMTPYPPGPAYPGYPPPPPPVGMCPSMTPYPPVAVPMTESVAPPYPSQPAPDQQPPSYSEATGQTHIYSKQSPYNPNF